MSTNLYKEAIAEAQQLKMMAEQNAKNKIIEALTPRIQAMVESQLLSEQSDVEIEEVDPDVMMLSTEEEPLEAQVPASDIEVLDAAATRISERASKRHRKLLLAFYVRKMSQNPQARERLKQLFSEAKAAKPKVNVKIPRKRLSFKVSRDFEKEFTELTKISGLKKTQVLRGVVQEIRSDLVYPENPVSLPQLREMVATLES